MMDYIFHYRSPIGAITLAGDGNALTGLWFDGQKFYGSTLPDSRIEKKISIFEDTVRWLDLYFDGKDPGFIPPLRLTGTSFQRSVWEILLTIPYGHTMTYGDIARRLAEEAGAGRVSAQAVGGAVGHNPISLIVPCHRVIGRCGKLTGYAGGLERKAWLLEMEKRA